MILQVCHSDTIGGASRASFRLFDALRRADEDVRLRVFKKRSDDPGVTGSDHPAARAVSMASLIIANKIVGTQKAGNSSGHSINLFRTGLAREINASGAAVVNLHWVNAEMMSIGEIGAIRLPTVVTLHDAWTFCGAEHYPAQDDKRYIDGYVRANRPLDHRGFDIDRWTWQRKQQAWRGKAMTVVCPSRWLADCASNSLLLRDKAIHQVPNPIDTGLFKPLDRSFAREALGLPRKGFLILFGAIRGGADPRKGFDLLAKALQRLAAIKGLPGDTRCVVSGQSRPESPPALGFPVHWLGHLHDSYSMVLAYNAADVVVVPSRQENLPQGGTEAHACGIPVVGFNATGLPDVVEHKATGYLAQPFDASDLAAGIQWVLEDPVRYRHLAEKARERAQQRWSEAVVVPQYLEVFRAARHQQQDRTIPGNRLALHDQ